MHNWNLAESSFSFLDKLQVCNFILTNSQLTMGDKTAEFEQKMAELSGIPYVVGVSSGSTANHLIFELYKQELNYNIENVVVIVPSTTWISSISPAIMAGYKIFFVDINLQDFCFDYDKLETAIIQLKSRGYKIILWPTALIGFIPDFKILNRLKEKYNTELWLDSCENTLSKLENGESVLGQCRFTTTSCYFSHQIQSLEFGFVFCKNFKDYEKAKLIRSHGMTRVLSYDSEQKQRTERENPNIDPKFLFTLEGSNFRPTDMHAVWGLLDFRRKERYIKHRKEIYNHYFNNLDSSKYYLPNKCNSQVDSVPFCLPIFIKEKNKTKELKELLNKNGIDTRPLISGNLLKHPVFKDKPYILNPRPPEFYENSEWIHNHALYVGLHNKIKKKHIDKLINLLNNFK